MTEGEKRVSLCFDVLALMFGMAAGIAETRRELQRGCHEGNKGVLRPQTVVWAAVRYHATVPTAISSTLPRSWPSAAITHILATVKGFWLVVGRVRGRKDGAMTDTTATLDIPKHLMLIATGCLWPHPLRQPPLLSRMLELLHRVLFMTSIKECP